MRMCVLFHQNVCVKILDALHQLGGRGTLRNYGNSVSLILWTLVLSLKLIVSKKKKKRKTLHCYISLVYQT